MKQELSPLDWQRLLVGEEPFAFLGEVLLRTLIMYMVLMFVMRALGKRMGGQISNLELSVMIALGAIVSQPMQAGERGILPAGVLLMCLLGLQRVLTVLGTRSLRIERFSQGTPTILVRDGRLLHDELVRARISKRQLFSSLRARGMRHLGEAKRVYLESGGVISVLRSDPAQEGLSVLPSKDERKGPS